MSGGWIKLEKDLRTDPRVLRMASQLDVTLDRHGCVTLVLGALAQIWMLADTHVAQGDVLPLGIDEINHIVGIQGFGQLIPQDWLQVIDADNVKLPGFHKHNGTIAKERAQGQKRNARYVKRRDGTPSQASDARSSLDLDLDLYLEKKNNKKKIAGRLPEDFALTQERGDYATQHGLNPAETYEAFCDYWRAANGANAIKRDWEAAWRTWVRSPYNQPKANGNSKPPQAPAERVSAEWAELLAAARAEGLGEPYRLETPQAYAERLRGFRAAQRPKLDTSALTNKLRTLL